jgi:Divergent InlB B-repeat domain
MRLTLLLATAAALLLVPAAAANAAINSHVTIAGNGSGSVVPITGEVELAGNPPIICHKPSQVGDVCDTEAVGEGLKGIKVTWEAGSGSEFAGWTVEKGNDAFGCSGTKTTECAVFLKEGEVKLKATFVKIPNVHIHLGGSGHGKVVSVAGETEGEPPVDCSNIAGFEATICEVLATENFIGFLGIGVQAIPDAESKFVGYTEKVGSDPLESCGFLESEPLNFPFCTIYLTELSEGEIQLTANFDALPKFPLTVTKTGGTGSGTVTSSPAGINCGATCTHEFLEGEEVTLTPTASEGSTFVEWTGACTGSGACVVPMNEAESVNAKFDLETRKLTVNNEGENGTVKCRFPPGGYIEPCEYNEVPVPYGTEVEVVATPESGEYLLAELNGFGSAAGKCSVGSGTCTFTIKANSEVEAVFAPAAIRATQEPNVEGHVEQTTKLEWLGGTPKCEKEGNPNVDFGEFYLEEPEREYLVECDLNVTTTGAETTLTAKDGSEVHKGHLIQTATHWGTEDPFALAKPLEMSAKSALYTPEECDESPQAVDASEGVILCDYVDPANNDTVTASFIQWIKQHERLHHGTYSKVITLTLEQIHP